MNASVFMDMQMLVRFVFPDFINTPKQLEEPEQQE
jgi:hypothetical protein